MAQGIRRKGHKNARAAARAASACRDELALIVPAFDRPERGSDSVAPGRRTPLIRSFALPPGPLRRIPCAIRVRAIVTLKVVGGYAPKKSSSLPPMRDT